MGASSETTYTFQEHCSHCQLLILSTLLEHHPMNPLSRTILGSVAMLSMLAVPLSAAEMQISDLRLSVGPLSNDFRGGSSTTFSDSGDGISSTRSSSDGRDSDSNWRVQLQYMRGHLGNSGGLIWGLGIAVNHARWEDGPRSAYATTPVIDALLGYGYAFTPQWHLELTGLAGYGRAYYSVSDDDSSQTSKDWETYIEYGGKLGSYYSTANGMVLGLEIPYLVGRFDADYDYDDGADSVTVSDELRNRGFGVLATIGLRF